MKVAKWKVLGVAGALVLGYAVSSQAFQLKVDDDTFMNVNYRLKVYYNNLDKDRTGNYTQKYFSTAGLLSFDGQINNLIQFYADWTDKTGGSLTWDAAYINFAFAPEFQVKLGGDTVPFSILELQGSTKAIVPVGSIDPASKVVLDDIIPGTEGMAELHGSLADGMINYAFALFNQSSPATGNSYKDLNYAARIDIVPTMWGYCGGYGPSYLGKKDVMNFGVGYVYMKDQAGNSTVGYASTKGWTVDFTFEKNLGTITPSFQVAYFNLDDTHFNGTDSRGSEQYTAQAQLLYNEVVGIGKPAIAFRYDKIIDDYQQQDQKVTRTAMALNYYIEGNAAKVSLVWNKNDYSDPNQPDIDDWYLFAQVRF